LSKTRRRRLRSWPEATFSKPCELARKSREAFARERRIDRSGEWPTVAGDLKEAAAPPERVARRFGVVERRGGRRRLKHRA
jgi:hypothetical protein